MASARGRQVCGFCQRGEEEQEVCGPLHVCNECSAHHKCMQYSAMLIQYRFSNFGGFKIKKVLDEISRGRRLKCNVCSTGTSGAKKKRFKKIVGATAGCAIAQCRRTYHFYCAKTTSNVITRRIEVTKGERGKEKKVVLYRVFCSEKHLKLFEKSVNDLRYLEESETSDSDGEEDSDSDDDSSKNTDPSQGSDPKVQVALFRKTSPKGFRFQPKVKPSATSSENVVSSEGDIFSYSYEAPLFSNDDSSSSLTDLPADLKKTVGTDDDVSEQSSEGHTSGTLAKDLKSQPYVSDTFARNDSQDISSSSDDSSIKVLDTKIKTTSPRRSPRKAIAQNENGSLSDDSRKGGDTDNITENRMNTNEKAADKKYKLKKEESFSENEGKTLCMRSAQLLGTITAMSGSESGTDTSKDTKKALPRKLEMPQILLADINKRSVNGEQRKSEARIVLTDISKDKNSGSRGKRSREPSNNDDKDEPKTKRVCSETSGKVISSSSKGASMTTAETSKDEIESEGYGSAAEACHRRGASVVISMPPREQNLSKVVNSKVPRSVSSPHRREAPSEDCVLCFLEREGNETMEYNRFISPIATKLFGVKEDSVYLWKFKADDAQVTSGHMVYFMKDISKAVRKKDFNLLSNILCDLDGESIHKYDSFVQLNEDYDPELAEELYHKLRESIKDNLAIASAELGKNIGSIHYFKSLTTHVVFLYLSSIVDTNRKIRIRLGHQNKPFVWTPDDEDIEFAYPTLTSETSNMIRNNEYEVLLRWIKLNIKKPRLIVRPREPYLQEECRSSIIYQVRAVLEEFCSDAQDAVDVITIGPLNKEVVRVWPYLKLCIPAVVDDCLTALKGIYLLYDVDSREVSSMQSLVPRLPDHVDYKVLCGQDPGKTPVTCVLLQVSLNQENVSTSSSSASDSSSVSSSTSTEILKNCTRSRLSPKKTKFGKRSTSTPKPKSQK